MLTKNRSCTSRAPRQSLDGFPVLWLIALLPVEWQMRETFDRAEKVNSGTRSAYGDPSRNGHVAHIVVQSGVFLIFIRFGGGWVKGMDRERSTDR